MVYWGQLLTSLTQFPNRKRACLFIGINIIDITILPTILYTQKKQPNIMSLLMEEHSIIYEVVLTKKNQLIKSLDATTNVQSVMG